MNQDNYSVCLNDGFWTAMYADKPIIKFSTNEEAWRWIDRQERRPLWRGSRNRFRPPVDWDNNRTMVTDMARMNWRDASKTYRRPILDYRHEYDVPDRAARWLAAVDRNQAQRRSRPREWRSATQVSSS
jgi:hypothetical protein